jgi:ribonucleoside-diphosphate reductase alpha chain
MRIERRYTTEGQSPYSSLAFRLATSEIRNPDGSVVFKLDGIEVPESWSQVACDVLAQKYFRKAGVPARLKKVEENDVPSWLWRSVPDEKALAGLPEDERYVSEVKSQQVFDRLAAAGPIGAGRAATSRPRRRPGLLRRDALHAREPDGGAE